MASIDAQLRLLAPGKVSDDDKLVEYDALLLDRFLDILQDLHGSDIRETVFSISISSPFFVFIAWCYLWWKDCCFSSALTNFRCGTLILCNGEIQLCSFWLYLKPRFDFFVKVVVFLVLEHCNWWKNLFEVCIWLYGCWNEWALKVMFGGFNCWRTLNSVFHAWFSVVIVL